MITPRQVMLLVTKKKTLKLLTLVRKSVLLTMFGLTFGFEKDQVRFPTKKVTVAERLRGV
jgi:hypothetical protein